MEIVRRKTAAAKSKTNSFITGLRRDNFDLCGSPRRSVNLSLLAVCSCVRRIVDREARELQRRAPTALRNAAGAGQTLFAGAPDFLDRNLILIGGHSERDELTKSGPSSVHSANRVERQSRAIGARDRDGAPTGGAPRNSALASSIVTDPRDYPDGC